MEEAFWMVWCPTGRPPMVRHMSESSAVIEAERLARMNPGSEFYVLQANQKRLVNDMQRVRLVSPVPF